MGSVGSQGLTVDLERGFDVLGVPRRLVDVPPEAQVRGLFFRLAEQAVAERSSDLLATWRVASGARDRWAVKMYAARDFIREQAVAAILLDPDDPGSALRRMWMSTTRLSPLINAEGFIRYLLRSKPDAALRWVASNRTMMCNFGRWRVEFPEPGHAVFHLKDEYVWIEHAQAAGAEGTLLRCGVSPSVTAELDSPYSGRLRITWN